MKCPDSYREACSLPEAGRHLNLVLKNKLLTDEKFYFIKYQSNILNNNKFIKISLWKKLNWKKS